MYGKNKNVYLVEQSFQKRIKSLLSTQTPWNKSHNVSHNVKHTREMKEMVCSQMYWRKYVKDFWMRNVHMCWSHFIIFHSIFMLSLSHTFCSLLPLHIYKYMCVFYFSGTFVQFLFIGRAILLWPLSYEQCNLWFSFTE